MAQQSANSSILREWAPLTDLFSKLPTKNQNGIFYQDVKLTCIDVLPEFLALGTNLGIVYWYDRNKKEMQRLRCENPNVSITVVKIISTVDYMVACGSNLGNVSIFQIPKSHPDSLPENLKPKKKEIERYTVTELHKAPISAIEWSKNGMKLFSGDKNGCVVLTEIDFYMHICKSIEILNESYEVVQLSFVQQKLLVSTTYRSIVCEKSNKWKVSQVGKKDRKILDRFGGTIVQQGYKPSDTTLYCARPGLRIWVSDVEGNVQKTLLFKDLLSKGCPEIPLINPISQNLRALKPQKEHSFGTLLLFSDNLLITHNNDVVYVLNMQDMTVLNTISHLRGILGMAACKDELFILEEDRSLIRISYRPEPINNETHISFAGNAFKPLASSIKDLTTNIISAIPPLLDNSHSNGVNVHTDESIIVKAEEARESPTESRTVDLESLKKFDDIGKREFSDTILFKKSKGKKKKSKMEGSATSISSNSSEERDLSYTRPTIMNLSSVGVLPDLRSPESIKFDIEYKEKILADILDLDRVKISTTVNNNKEINENVGKLYTSDKDDSESETKMEKLTKAKKGGSQSKTKMEKLSTSKKDGSQIKTKMEEIKIEDREEEESDFSKILNKAGNSKEITLDLPKNINISPACVNIPFEWNLSSIQLPTRKPSPDSSFSDWEII